MVISNHISESLFVVEEASEEGTKEWDVVNVVKVVVVQKMGDKMDPFNQNQNTKHTRR